MALKICVIRAICVPFSVPQEAANLLNLFNHREAVCFSNVTQIAPITQIFLEPRMA